MAETAHPVADRSLPWSGCPALADRDNDAASLPGRTGGT